jgi:hypothetical protein
VDLLPEDYLQALDRFNRGRYHDARGILLKLAQDHEDERGFFYGILQLSSGLSLLLQPGTGLGSGALFAEAASNLRPFRPWHRGLDVDEIIWTLEQLEQLCRAIAAALPPDFDPLGLHRPWPDVSRLLPLLKLRVQQA